MFTSKKLRRILRNAINMGEKIFKKSGIVTELAYTVADNLDAAYPELHNNLKQVMQKIPEIILVGKKDTRLLHMILILLDTICQVQRIIDFEEDLFKRLRNTSGKKWSKMIEIRPELASITDWMAPGLVDGYKELQSMLKEL